MPGGRGNSSVCPGREAIAQDDDVARLDAAGNRRDGTVMLDAQRGTERERGLAPKLERRGLPVRRGPRGDARRSVARRGIFDGGSARRREAQVATRREGDLRGGEEAPERKRALAPLDHRGGGRLHAQRPPTWTFRDQPRRAVDPREAGGQLALGLLLLQPREVRAVVDRRRRPAFRRRVELDRAAQGERLPFERAVERDRRGHPRANRRGGRLEFGLRAASQFQ
jgi:hypothetical protein